MYRTSLPVRDLENFRPMDFFSTECACKFEKHKQSLLSENYEKIFPNKNINNLTHMKSINNLSLVKTIIELSIIKA